MRHLSAEQAQILRTFDETLAWARRNEHDPATIAELLVTALANSPVERRHLTSAYDKLGI